MWVMGDGGGGVGRLRSLGYVSLRAGSFVFVWGGGGGEGKILKAGKKNEPARTLGLRCFKLNVMRVSVYTVVDNT